MSKKVTRERAMELLHYSPVTGVFTWLQNRSGGGAKAGKVAGSIGGSGRRYIDVDGKKYAAHRLAFLMVTGQWPNKLVDHIDRDPLNNAWSNLREATHAQNSQNCEMRARNRSGYRGVSFHKSSGKWTASIKANGVLKHLGSFNTKKDAAEAYYAASRELHGEFGGSREAELAEKDRRISQLEAAVTTAIDRIKEGYPNEALAFLEDSVFGKRTEGFAMIDVTTAGDDGHWDHADIKRLCEYRDRLKAALRKIIALGDCDDSASKMYWAAREVMPSQSETEAAPAIGGNVISGSHEPKLYDAVYECGCTSFGSAKPPQQCIEHGAPQAGFGIEWRERSTSKIGDKP